MSFSGTDTTGEDQYAYERVAIQKAMMHWKMPIRPCLPSPALA